MRAPELNPSEWVFLFVLHEIDKQIYNWILKTKDFVGSYNFSLAPFKTVAS